LPAWPTDDIRDNLVAMAERLDRVQVATRYRVVEITWHERDVLLEELAFAPGMMAVRRKFEAAAASRPVELDDNQQADLRKALDDWGSDTLQPDGIARLHAALRESGPGT
jgi:hypothetical protein